MPRRLGVPYESWMKKLRNLQVNNGALMAMDYQTGEILAYVGSAGYYRDDLSSRRSSSPSSTCSPTAGGSLARPSSRSTTSPASTTAR